MTAAPQKLIINVAPNGARRLKQDHPAIPLTAKEMAETAARCREAGAAMLHLHVRDADGAHLLDAEAYKESIAAVRRAVGEEMVVQITTEAVGRYSPAEQMAVVREVRPEAVSLALREIIPDEAAERDGAAFLAELWRARTFIQHILYSAEDVSRFLRLRSRGIIPGGQVLFVLGRYTPGQVSQPTDLLPFLAAWSGEAGELPPGWSVCAFGRHENACAMAAAALGGHARVGFENNLWLADGSLAPENAALVDQLARGAPLLGRAVADAGAARAIMAEESWKV
ncbi:3-keto-5-aminohexanoate cleavage protein [Telmatospirillum sp. J64-1]|uniref:3-keto-5-aminohexanoate cleavage protein n=1 Tax=Telmatospirillum sp. J64-1 TaxID=2502183 RepID=UPI00115EF5CC|nr:3-keto-5-aminohexanoate cleavage protein [Telmatospirillum sp. J64-1]